MKTYNVINYDLCGDGTTPNSRMLSELIDTLPDDSMLFFQREAIIFRKM